MDPILLLVGGGLLLFFLFGRHAAAPAPAPHPGFPPPSPGLPPPAPGGGGIIPVVLGGGSPDQGGFTFPGGPTPSSPRQAAALAMITEINRVGGFRLYDQPVYIAYQQSAGLTADGFPGRHTMGSLATDAAALGVNMPNVPTYPWRARTGTMADYDGVNAPMASEWLTPSPN